MRTRQAKDGGDRHIGQELPKLALQLSKNCRVYGDGHSMGAPTDAFALWSRETRLSLTILKHHKNKHSRYVGAANVHL